MRCIIFLWLLLPIQNFAQSDSIHQLFIEDKIKYENYEQKHRNHFQSKHSLIHYLTWGDPKDSPLIWLHGSFSNAYEIQPYVHELIANHIYVIAIDYYGHGKTKFPKTNVSVDHLAEDISQLLSHLNIDKAIIGGFSRGAYLATSFYNNYPQKTRALILEDGGIVGLHHNLKNKSKSELADFINHENQNKPPTLFQEYDYEIDAYKALLRYSNSENSFINFSFIHRNDAGKYSIYKEQDFLYYMNDTDRFVEMILTPKKTSLFQQSLLKLGLQHSKNKLSTPTLLLEAQSNKDPLPYDKEYENFYNKNSYFVKHLIYDDTDHNIHFQHPKRFERDVINFIKSTL